MHWLFIDETTKVWGLVSLASEIVEDECARRNMFNSSSENIKLLKSLPDYFPTRPFIS